MYAPLRKLEHNTEVSKVKKMKETKHKELAEDAAQMDKTTEETKEKEEILEVEPQNVKEVNEDKEPKNEEGQKDRKRDNTTETKRQTTKNKCKTKGMDYCYKEQGDLSKDFTQGSEHLKTEREEIERYLEFLKSQMELQ
jgi:hypothetical protein